MKLSKNQSEKFRKVTSGGYRIAEVDRFLKTAAARIDKGEKDRLSNELDSAQFTITKRAGYDPKEVDDHLDSLVQRYGLASPISQTSGQSSQRSSFSRRDNEPQKEQQTGLVIDSKKLRTLTPPIADGVGYAQDEVDHFLATVADSLERFENVQGKELDALRSDQYIVHPGQKPLLAGDQVRYALFSVSENGGYDMLGVDAAVNRLAEALDYHWSRTS